MKKKNIILFVIFIIILGGVSVFNLTSSPKEKGRLRRVRVTPPVATVSVEKIKIGDIEYKVQTVGDILPLMTVDIVSKVSGYIEKINVNQGDSVKENQLIAFIESKELEERVKEIEARVARAKARVAELRAGARPEEIAQAEESVNQARLRFENARINLNRIRELFQKDLVPRKELDDAELLYDLSNAQYISTQNQLKIIKEGARIETRLEAEAQLKETDALLEQEKMRLGNTKIFPPFSGYISKKFLEKGSYVTPSTPIITLIHTETVKVLISVPERDVPVVKYGTVARIKVDALPDRVFEGRVERLNSALDLATRTLQVEVFVPNQKNILKPGMFARIDLILFKRSKTLLIPEQAILEENGKKFVFVPEEKKAKKIYITTGLSKDNLIEVVGGLEKYKEVIVSGQNKLNEGTPIQIIQ